MTAARRRFPAGGSLHNGGRDTAQKCPAFLPEIFRHAIFAPISDEKTIVISARMLYTKKELLIWEVLP